MSMTHSSGARAIKYLSLIICAWLPLGMAPAKAQFLRDATHQPPVFFDESRMNHYYVDKEWLQDPEELAPLRAMEIPFEWAQGWIKDPRTFTRAMVMGQPESCPLMAGVYGAPDTETAVRLAFTSCFYQMRLLEPHQQEDCGCQLAMLDQVVYVEPGEFTNFAASPAIVSFEDDEQEDILGIVYFGDELLGQDQSISFVDSNGQQRCNGEYSINAFLFNDLELACDFYCEPYKGGIKINDFSFNQNGFKPTAEVKARTCSGAMATLRVGKMHSE